MRAMEAMCWLQILKALWLAVCVSGMTCSTRHAVEASEEIERHVIWTRDAVAAFID